MGCPAISRLLKAAGGLALSVMALALCQKWRGHQWGRSRSQQITQDHVAQLGHQVRVLGALGVVDHSGVRHGADELDQDERREIKALYLEERSVRRKRVSDHLLQTRLETAHF